MNHLNGHERSVCHTSGLGCSSANGAGGVIGICLRGAAHFKHSRGVCEEMFMREEYYSVYGSDENFMAGVFFT